MLKAALLTAALLGTSVDPCCRHVCARVCGRFWLLKFTPGDLRLDSTFRSTVLPYLVYQVCQILCVNVPSCQANKIPILMPT